MLFRETESEFLRFRKLLIVHPQGETVARRIAVLQRIEHFRPFRLVDFHIAEIGLSVDADSGFTAVEQSGRG